MKTFKAILEKYCDYIETNNTYTINYRLFDNVGYLCFEPYHDKVYLKNNDDNYNQITFNTPFHLYLFFQSLNPKQVKNEVELSIEQLEKQRRDWYEEASLNKNFSKLSTIGKYLENDKQNESYGPKYRFKIEDYYLFVDNYGGYLTLEKSNIKICSTHHCSQLYIKSECDSFIEKYYLEALTIKEEKENKQKQKELDKLKHELLIS
jgi:hypothetical protein